MISTQSSRSQRQPATMPGQPLPPESDPAARQHGRVHRPRPWTTELSHAILFSLLTMILLGGLYPLFVWGIGRTLFPAEVEGSLLYRPDGTILGSKLIAQPFAGAGYFRPRPSAVDYNAASTGGSNYGPSNPDHLDAVRGRLEAIVAADQVPAERVPSEMVTASGAGLDPHIPPAAAEIQLARVAGARGVAPQRVREIVLSHTEPPFLGLFGRERINVLALNLALDLAFGQPEK